MANKWKSNTTRIKGLIRERGITIKQFSEGIGCNFSTAQYKMSGKSNFTVDEAARAANFLNESPLIFFENQIDNISNSLQ
jgi:transcriptional regulator with XRE-family HTH domain